MSLNRRPLWVAVLDCLASPNRAMVRSLLRRCVLPMIAAILLATGGPLQAVAKPRVFDDFIVANGAITVFAKGDYVEPYTAIHALLVAHRLGIDVSVPASALAHWLQPYQQANGPFPRVCRSGNSNVWLACGPADADDSMAVLWCQMTSEILSNDRTLDKSCLRALENLATLWDPKLHTFRAVFGQQVAYFADNIEVINGLGELRHNQIAAERYAAPLGKLPSKGQLLVALYHNYGFHPEHALLPQRASIPATPYGFYPYAVAPAYAWLHKISGGSIAAGNWKIWKKRYGDAWLGGTVDYFPWGLIALAAYQLGDQKTATSWLKNSAKWRQQGRWNVLEEGVQLGLTNVLQNQYKNH